MEPVTVPGREQVQVRVGVMEAEPVTVPELVPVPVQAVPAGRHTRR